MSGKVVTLTIAPAVTSNDNVVVAYAVPALNALHDATGNDTAPFTFAAANQTPIVAPPASAAAAAGRRPAPDLVSVVAGRRLDRAPGLDDHADGEPVRHVDAHDA